MLHRALGEECKGMYMILLGALFCHDIHPMAALLRLAQQRDKGNDLEADDGATQTLVVVSKSSHSLHVSP